MNVSLDQLRRYAVSRSLFRAPNILSAVNQLGYVQADPIRAPARAQDLILFQRVDGYRMDDLETQYPQLPIIEDTIYNYGFFPESHHALLHPRIHSPYATRIAKQHKAIRAALVDLLNNVEELHPREAERMIGAGRRLNGWGGTSSTTTVMLDILHREGLAFVARRDKGIKVYQGPHKRQHLRTDMAGNARAKGLVETIVNLYAPIVKGTLLTFLRMMEKRRPGVHCVETFHALTRDGTYHIAKLDGIEYVWPAAESLDTETKDEVRLLAPFDPIVWDRKRFAHFWAWDYRFEAYTPATKRVRGYYALPMLWRDDVVGWANVRVENGNAIIAPGLAKNIVMGRAFHAALDREATRMARFLTPRKITTKGWAQNLG
jgi:uncharacterized protein